MHDRPAARTPALVWVLVGAAVLQLAILVAMDWYRVFGPYLILRPQDLVRVITAVGPFLLAAAALAGATRWPAGRRWVVAGALAMAVHGLVQGALSVAWAWLTSGSVMIEGPVQVALVTANIALAVTRFVAFGLLAVGLWRAASAGLAWAAVPRLAGSVAAAVVGVVAVVPGALLMLSELQWLASSGLGAEHAPLIAVNRVLGTLGAVAMAGLAVAALRAVPRRGGSPEALVAAGALAVVASAGWEWGFQWLVPTENQVGLELWAFMLPQSVFAAGTVALIAGFAAAALAVRRATAR